MRLPTSTACSEAPKQACPVCHHMFMFNDTIERPRTSRIGTHASEGAVFVGNGTPVAVR